MQYSLKLDSLFDQKGRNNAASCIFYVITVSVGTFPLLELSARQSLVQPSLIVLCVFREQQDEDRRRYNRDGRYDRKRRRSPSQERYREYGRTSDRDRRRSRSPSPHGRRRSDKRRDSRSLSSDVQPGVLPVADDKPFAFGEVFDKEAEQKKLEAEMAKRRERIERARLLRKKDLAATPLPDLPKLSGSQGKWSLEDETEETDEVANGGGVKKVEDEVDPLDAFMETVQSEVQQIKKYCATVTLVDSRSLECDGSSISWSTTRLDQNN